MPESSRITASMLRSVYRLVGEVRELGAVPEVWRTHLLERLNTILETRVGFVIQARPYKQGAAAALASVVSVGLNGRECTVFMAYLAEGIQRDPAFEPRMKLFLRGRNFTSVRRDFVPDDHVWYRSPTIEEYSNPLQVDDNIISDVFFPNAKGSQSLYFLREKSSRRPLGTRERRLLHLLHSELDRIWSAAALEQTAPPLPPRLSQTLSLLRAGLSEKQIAFRLGLSRHSTHDLIKRLHKKYNVDSRVDLLQASLPSVPKFCPAITT